MPVIVAMLLVGCSYQYRELSEAEKLEVMRYAEQYLGAPYLLGGQTQQGIDCSGLLIVAMNGIGIDRFLNQSHELASDVNAHELAVFNALPVEQPDRGDWVAFYDESEKYYHISIFDSFTANSILVLDASTAGNGYVEYREIEMLKSKPHDFLTPIRYFN